MKQTKHWLWLTYALTAFVCFSSLYYFKYLPFTKSLSSLEHMRLEYFRQGGVWDDSYLDSPQAIARQRLNLNAWGGFHELKIDQLFTQNNMVLSYDVELTENSYIYLYLDRSHEEKALGVRLSLNKDYSSIFFIKNGKGKFLEKKTLKAKPKPGTNKVSITYKKPNIHFSLNGSEVLMLNRPAAFEDGFIFAWGGSTEVFPVSIDNILLTDLDKKVLYENSFDLVGNEVQLIDILALIGLMLFIIFGLRLVKDEKVRLTASVTILLFFTQSGLLYHFYLSADYIEGVDDEVTRNQVQDFMRNRVNQFEERLKKSGKKIFFYGGSKTVGVGAREKEDTWFKLVEKDFSGGALDLMNFGTISADSEDLIYLHKKLHKYSPELVMVLSGVNDHNPETYLENMKKLVELDPKTHFLLVQESTYLDDLSKINDKSAYINFAKLAPLCERTNIDCLRLDDKMYRTSDSLYDSGILWVEWVHYNSYGQELFYKLLRPELERKFKQL